MTPLRLIPRVLILGVVIIALFGGLGSGLARLGWETDPLSRSWILIHGPLMISGFLGTLIGLERAVALAARFPASLIVPMINAIGAACLLLMPESPIAKALLVVSSLGLIGLFGIMLRLHPVREVIIMTLGAITWLIGNMLWFFGAPVYQVVHLWTAFLILTIVGERLELSRIRRLSVDLERALSAAVGVYWIGVLITPVDLAIGMRVFGVGAIGMAVWLGRYDIARRTITHQGLPRYIAACLLIGYAWLGVGGLLAIYYGPIIAGFAYASVLHALLLGFVFSMIFGHAPIVIPALTGLQLQYHPVLYLPLIGLHATLIYRMYGQFWADLMITQQGAFGNVIAIVGFLGMMIAIVLLGNAPRLIRQRA
ncbi:MAG: hypothetical protein MUF87_16295 [Anaerolineae bacterium]|jgi:hypothetical protein|nr:hypothetical protein [Anaerolineae bacterium]